MFPIGATGLLSGTDSVVLSWRGRRTQEKMLFVVICYLLFVIRYLLLFHYLPIAGCLMLGAGCWDVGAQRRSCGPAGLDAGLSVVWWLAGNLA
jgi:hypothetical protein